LFFPLNYDGSGFSPPSIAQGSAVVYGQQGVFWGVYMLV
jgi:hypothetical protein